MKKKANLVRYVQFSFIRFFSSNQKAMLHALWCTRPEVEQTHGFSSFDMDKMPRWKGLLKESENPGGSSAEKHFYSHSLLWQGPQTYHLSPYQA